MNWDPTLKTILQSVAAGMLLAGLTQASVETFVIVGLVVIGVIVAHRIHKKRKKVRFGHPSRLPVPFFGDLEAPSPEERLDAAFREAWIAPAEMTIARIDAALTNQHEPVISYVALYNEVKRLTAKNRALNEKAEILERDLKEVKYGSARPSAWVNPGSYANRDYSWGATSYPGLTETTPSEYYQ